MKSNHKLTTISNLSALPNQTTILFQQVLKQNGSKSPMIKKPKENQVYDRLDKSQSSRNNIKTQSEHNLKHKPFINGSVLQQKYRQQLYKNELSLTQRHSDKRESTSTVGSGISSVQSTKNSSKNNFTSNEGTYKQQLMNITNNFKQRQKSITKQSCHSRLQSDQYMMPLTSRYSAHKVIVINMDDDDDEEDDCNFEQYNQSDIGSKSSKLSSRDSQQNESINIQFVQAKSRNLASNSLSRTSSNIKSKDHYFYNIDYNNKIQYDSSQQHTPVLAQKQTPGTNKSQTKKKLDFTQIKMTSQLNKQGDNKLTQEIKEGLIKALDELNSDVMSLKFRMIDRMSKFRKVVRRIMNKIQVQKIQNRLQHIRMKNYAAIKIQKWFMQNLKMRKSPYYVLKKHFGTSFNDGIYLGYRIRKIFRKLDIQIHVSLIKELQFQANRNQDTNGSQRILQELKVQLTSMIEQELKLRHFKSVNEKDFIQRQIDVSDQVLHSIESNNFDNQQMFNYLNEFDYLFPEKIKGTASHIESIRPYQEKYETFNRVRVMKEVAQNLQVQNDSVNEIQEFNLIQCYESSQLQPDHSQKVETKNPFNNESEFNTRSSQSKDQIEKLNEVDHFKVSDMQSLNFEFQVKQDSLNQFEPFSPTNNFINDTFNESNIETSSINLNKLVELKQQTQNDQFLLGLTMGSRQDHSTQDLTLTFKSSLNGQSKQRTASASSHKRLMSLKKQYCQKNSNSKIQQINISNQKSVSRSSSTTNKSPITKKHNKSVEQIQTQGKLNTKMFNCSLSPQKNRFLPNTQCKENLQQFSPNFENSIRKQQQSVESPNKIRFTNRRERSIERIEKREKVIDGMRSFYESLDNQNNVHLLNEDQKEALQMKLEKMFINLRGCLNDIINKH
eukprot:403367509